MLRIFQAPADRSNERGLSLVEILTILVILGFVSAVAVISLPEGESNARQEARRFVAAFSAAQDLAIIRGEIRGLEATGEDYTFYLNLEGRWVPQDSHSLGESAPGVALAIGLPGAAFGQSRLSVTPYSLPGRAGTVQEPPFRPAWLIRPTGAVDPFTVRFDGEDDSWTVTVEADGSASLTREGGNE